MSELLCIDCGLPAAFPYGRKPPWICISCQHIRDTNPKPAAQGVVDDDPITRLKAIRSGQLDDNRPAYEEITGWLQRVPITWLPGLLLAVIHQCVTRKVFTNDEGMVNFTNRAIHKSSKETWMLRDTTTPSTGG